MLHLGTSDMLHLGTRFLMSPYEKSCSSSTQHDMMLTIVCVVFPCTRTFRQPQITSFLLRIAGASLLRMMVRVHHSLFACLQMTRPAWLDSDPGQRKNIWRRKTSIEQSSKG
ncbi:uncharacterized protein LOC103790467 [Callithrix jacchus]